MAVMAELSPPEPHDSVLEPRARAPREATQQAALDTHLLTIIVGAAGDHDRPLLRRQLLDLHPADTAALLAAAPRETARTVFALIGAELDPEVFAEIDEDLRELAFEILPPEQMARALDDLDTDDATAIIAELEPQEREEVLARTSDEVRVAVEAGLAFDEETAGRLMQREFVAAPEHWDVGRTIDHMRRTGEDLPDLFFEVYIVDPAFRPVGVVPVSKIMRSPRAVTLQELMEPPPVVVSPQTDQEDVALAFQKYHLISAPVVNEAGQITGMITVDDVVQVIQEENQEDLLALAGVSDASASDSVWESVKARLPWLGVNVLTALTASWFIGRFEHVLAEVVALAILMPIVASLGGNAGTQTLAVAVRALAARTVTAGNTWRIVGREVLTGLANGLVVAAILATATFIWFHKPMITLTIALAVLLNFTAAGLAGILVPLTLRKLGQDPAVSSSVFVTFVTDLVGFVAFLGLAMVLISGV
jgi:magnesium transporter